MRSLGLVAVSQTVRLPAVKSRRSVNDPYLRPTADVVKTAEWIEISFGVVGRMGPKVPCISWWSRTPMGTGQGRMQDFILGGGGLRLIGPPP